MTQRIVLAGASGLIGRALATALRQRGADLRLLVRREPTNRGELRWHAGGEPPSRDVLDALAGADALISLGGASVGRLPWTRSYKRELRDSRLDTTRALATALRELGGDAPATWLSASAVGYYGSQPGERLTEVSSAGDTFLAKLCVEWEAAALEAADLSRIVLLRTAPVIHPEGVLKPMIALTRLGLGGPLGRGSQGWPWISLDDEVRGVLHALDHGLAGPVNLTGPAIVTANDVGRALARRLRRPFLIPAPAFALRLALGRDTADSLLLADAAVVPEALQQSGFRFGHATPEEAIRASLG